MDSPRSDGADIGALERRAGRLLALLALAALACVVASAVVRATGGSALQPLARRLASWASTLIVSAPMASLAGVALMAWSAHPRLGRFALGALLVTLAGIGLAR